MTERLNCFFFIQAYVSYRTSTEWTGDATGRRICCTHAWLPKQWDNQNKFSSPGAFSRKRARLRPPPTYQWCPQPTPIANHLPKWPCLGTGTDPMPSVPEPCPLGMEQSQGSVEISIEYDSCNIKNSCKPPCKCCIKGLKCTSICVCRGQCYGTLCLIVTYANYSSYLIWSNLYIYIYISVFWFTTMRFDAKIWQM